MSYEVSVLRTATEIAAVLPQWRQLRSAQSRPHADQHPEWLLQRFGRREAFELEVVTIHEHGELLGLAPVVKNETRRFAWRLRLPGKDVSLHTWRLRQAAFLGDSLLAVEDLRVQRALLEGLLASYRDCHLVAFSNLSCESMLHRLLTKELRLPFASRWKPCESQTRWQLEVVGSFEAFLTRQHSPRRRQDMRREFRRLSESCPGGLRFIVVTRPEDIEEFVRNATLVASNSWQGRRHGAADKLARTTKLLKKLAEQDLFRGYLLANGDEPIAFEYGRLSDQVFTFTATAYDQKWAKFSPGAQLLQQVIAELFATGVARWLDFGVMDLSYKESWATSSYEEEEIFYLYRSPRLALALGPTIITRKCISTISRALRPFGLQVSFRRLLYRLSRGRVKR